MPTYEYECPVCGNFTASQKMSDKPLKQRPGCDNKKCPKKAVRLISGGTFHLKGGGWYKDGYGSSSKSTSSEATSSSKSTEGSSTSAATAEKPAKSGGCGSGCGCHSN